MKKTRHLPLFQRKGQTCAGRVPWPSIRIRTPGLLSRDPPLPGRQAGGRLPGLSVRRGAGSPAKAPLLREAAAPPLSFRSEPPFCRHTRGGAPSPARRPQVPPRLRVAAERRAGGPRWWRGGWPPARLGAAGPCWSEVAEGAGRPRPAGRGAGRPAGPGRAGWLPREGGMEGRRDGTGRRRPAGGGAGERGSAEAVARGGGPGQPRGRRRDDGGWGTALRRLGGWGSSPG